MNLTPRKGLSLAACALLACATVVAYLPTFHAGFIWDDDTLLTSNPLIKAADGLRRFWFTAEATDYWPVSLTTFWMEWRLWGLHAAGYHATNLVLHIAESLLLWRVLQRLGVPAAFLAAMLFALHPVNVASVAWIAERKNLMAMLFYLTSLFCFLGTDMASPTPEGFGPDARKPGEATRRWKWYFLSLLAFALAMLSKGSVALLPLVLLGVILWRRRPEKRDAVRLAPFFLVAAALTLVNVWFQAHGWHPVRGPAGADRVLKAAALVWFYLYKAVIPANLVLLYPEWHVHLGDPIWWIPIVAAFAATFVFWFCRRSWGRPWLFAWAYFCAALLPVLGFTNIGMLQFTPAADHYEHLALIGVVAMASAGWSLWHDAAPRSRIPWAVAIAVVGLLMGLTWKQCRIYSDAETLYEYVLRANPGAWLAHNNLGQVLYSEGRAAEAAAHFEAALRLNPESADANDNLGIILAEEGKDPEAIAHYEAALRSRPAYPDARNNLGNALRRTGRVPEAIAEYEQALQLKPDMAVAENGLGLALAASGRRSEAIDHYRRALLLDPELARTHLNLGNALAQEGQLAEAKVQLTEALRLEPNSSDAHFYLGVLLTNEGHLPAAIANYAECVRLNPNNADAENNMGVALAKVGRLSEAIDHLEVALRLRPDYTDARENLRTVRHMAGKE